MSNVTISSQVISNWQDTRTTTQLWIFAQSAFIASDGTPILSGNLRDKVAVKKVTCTVDTNAKTITIPSFTLTSTVDGLDITTSTYFAVFVTPQGAQIKLFDGFEQGFRLPATPSTQTWEQIRTYNFTRVVSRDNSSYTKDESDRRYLVSGAIDINDIAPITASRALMTDGSGVIGVSAVTSTELGYLSGVSGAIQTQLGQKITDPMTTIGDMLIRNGANANARLGIGSPGQVLTASGGIPSWQTPSSGFADPLTTRGDIIYRNTANTTARLAVGAANSVMVSDGTDPSWSATPRLNKLGLGGAAGTQLLVFTNPTPVANETLMSKNDSTFSTNVGSLGAGTVINLHALDMHNTDTVDGNSFLFGHSIIVEHDAIDCGAGIAITNKGRSDGMYIVVRGKAGAASMNSPTGIGMDLNLSTGGVENSTTFGGYGIQIWDRSTTDIGTSGPTAIFLYKQGNLNSQHRMLRIDSNRDSIVMFTNSGILTTADILYVSDGTTKKFAIDANGGVSINVESAATNTTSAFLTIAHRSTGTAAASFGTGINFKLESSTTTGQDAAQVAAIWTTATHASRTSAITFSLVNNAAAQAEAARLSNVTSGYAWALGTNNPEANIHIKATDAQPASMMNDATGSSAAYIARRANGTTGSLTALVTNDVIGNLAARGYDGSAYTSAGRAKMEFIAAGNWSGSSHPTQIDFYTTPSASTTQTKRASILESGELNAVIGYQVNGVALAASHLSNGVTGSGAVALAGSPTFTGTVGAAAITATGNLLVGGTQNAFGAASVTALLNLSTALTNGAGNASALRVVSVLTPLTANHVFAVNISTTAGSSTEDIGEAVGVNIGSMTKGNSGTLTSVYGLRVVAQAATSTNAYGIDIGLPTGGSSLNLAARFGGAIAIDEQAGTPANPTQDTRVHQYLKGDKFIYQFNSGGSLHYFYLDLTATTNQSLIYSASAP